MEIVKYRNKTYTAVRPIDKPDERLLTIEKQAVAKEMLNRGMEIAEISKKLKVDESVLTAWWDIESKILNISKANKAIAEGKVKKVCMTDLDTGKTTIFPSLSSCGRYLSTTACTIRRNLLLKKKYKHYTFEYLED